MHFLSLPPRASSSLFYYHTFNGRQTSIGMCNSGIILEILSTIEPCLKGITFSESQKGVLQFQITVGDSFYLVFSCLLRVLI